MRRWLRRGLIVCAVLLVLLLLAVLTVHLVLRTDWPRQRLLAQLRQQTGLNIDAASLDVRWGGRTILRDLTVALPLDADPFLTVPELRLDHTSLLGLAFTWSLRIDEVMLRDPHLTLQPDATGRWNLVEAAELIASSQGKPAADDAAAKPPVSLPQLRISGGTVRVQAPDGSFIRYSPIAVQGGPDTALAWAFNATLAPHVMLEGRLSPTELWAHEVQFDIDQIHSLIRPWLGPDAKELRLVGRWNGQVSGSDLQGHLDLTELRAAPLTLRGQAQVNVDGFNARIQPTNMLASIDDTPIRDLRIRDGSVLVQPDMLQADRLTLALHDVVASVDARWSLAEHRGRADVQWTSGGTWLPVQHTGHFKADASRSALGSFEADLELQAAGRYQNLAFDTALTGRASGESWQTAQASFDADRLRLDEPRGSASLGNTGADLQLNWPRLHVRNLSLPSGAAEAHPDASASVTGTLDLQTLVWSARVEARHWQPPATWQEQRLPTVDRFSSNASGDRDQATLDDLDLVINDTSLDGSVTLAFDTRQLDGDLVLTTSPSIPRDDLAVRSVVVRGKVSGPVQPLKLTMDGRVTAEGVAFRDTIYESLTTTWRGRVTEENATLSFDPLALLDGTVAVDVDANLDTRTAAVTLDTADADLAALLALAGQSLDASGRVTANLTAAVDPAALDATDVRGNWSIRSLDLPGFTGLDARGKVQLLDQQLTVSDLHVTDRDGSLTGSVKLAVDKPELIRADLTLRDWPWSDADGAWQATLSGRADVDVDTTSTHATGSIELDAALRHRDTSLGSLRAEATVNERLLTITTFQGDLLDTELTGKGAIQLDPETWTDSRIELAWKGLDAQALTRIDPVFASLRGVSRGRLVIERDERPRAIEPMRLTIEASLTDASIRGIALRQAADPDADAVEPDVLVDLNFSTDRLVLQRATAGIMGGKLQLNGRVSRHDGTPFAHVSFRLIDLDLQQLAHFAELTDEPMPGRVNGSGFVAGYLDKNPRQLGQASLTLTESDLVALPGVAELYSTLRLDVGRIQPTGEGRADLRLRGRTLEITRLTYFNRGTDLLARMTIDDLARGSQSEFEGMAVGVLRPLGRIDVPYLEILDRLTKAVQSDTSAVRIEGTLENRKTTVVPFPEVAGALNRLFRGEVD